jgi:hypothetical protein
MKTALISIFTIIFLSLIFQGCKNKVYNNKPIYEIGVNETVEIYYSTNSCCRYCILNEKELKHIKLMDDKLIVAEKEGCEGCSHTSAFVFLGTSKGIDTLELKNSAVSLNCDSNNVEPEKYIIEIK